MGRQLKRKLPAVTVSETVFTVSLGETANLLSRWARQQTLSRPPRQQMLSREPIFCQLFSEVINTLLRPFFQGADHFEHFGAERAEFLSFRQFLEI